MRRSVSVNNSAAPHSLDKSSSQTASSFINSSLPPWTWARAGMQSRGTRLSMAEAPGNLLRCQLRCWENIHPFTIAVFHPLQPEWGNMLGFCICNWGRTDGGGTVGSNTAIKIIYTACNSPSCGDRGGPASARVPTWAAGRWAQVWGSFCCWDILVGFDRFYYFPSPGMLLVLQSCFCWEVFNSHVPCGEHFLPISPT